MQRITETRYKINKRRNISHSSDISRALDLKYSCITSIKVQFCIWIACVKTGVISNCMQQQDFLFDNRTWSFVYFVYGDFLGLFVQFIRLVKYLLLNFFKSYLFFYCFQAWLNVERLEFSYVPLRYTDEIKLRRIQTILHVKC